MFVCKSAQQHYYNFRAKAKYLLKKALKKTLMKSQFVEFQYFKF